MLIPGFPEKCHWSETPGSGTPVIRYMLHSGLPGNFDDAVEVARAGREKGGGTGRRNPLWKCSSGLLCSGCLLSDDEREPISLKSMQQQQELQRASMPPAAAARVAACQHATCSSSMRMHPCVCSQYNSMDVQVQILCVHVCMHNAYAYGVCPCVHALCMLTKSNCECQNL